MKRLGPILFRACVVFLWLAVAGLALECHHALRWRGIARSNPFVVSMVGDAAWPTDPEDGSSSLGDEAAKRAAAPSAEAALPDARAEMTSRMAYFATLGAYDKSVFANTYGRTVVELNAQGEVLFFYTALPCFGMEESIEGLCGTERARAIFRSYPRVFQTGRIEFLPFPSEADEDGTPEIALFPVKAPSGRVELVAAMVDAPVDFGPWLPPDSLWERRFFMYRKHVHHEDWEHAYGLVEEFHTNNFGFRDDDVVVPKPPGVFRILCVGASTTEEGPTNALTYPNILEERLDAQFGPGRAEVINCGIAGFNTTKQRMRLPDYLALEPDLIICYNGANDICHELFPHWVAEAKLWQKLLRRSRFVNYHLNRCLLPSAEEAAACLERGMLRNLRRIYGYLRERDVAMAVCSFALPDITALTPDERDYYDFWHEKNWGGPYVTFATYCRTVHDLNLKLREMCQQEGIPYIPVAESVKAGLTKGIFPNVSCCFRDICHMKDKGIELKVDAVFTFLRERFGEKLAKPD